MAGSPPSNPGAEAWDSILSAAVEGAPWAWSQIYSDVAPGLAGFARVNGSADPEDVVGEVFLQIAKHLGEFDGSWEAFRGWAFVIAHNRLVDERRRKRRRPADPVADVDDRPAGNTEDEAVAALSTQELIEMLDPLPDAQRDVLTLRFVGGFTIREIAQTMGKREGAVKALQRRGVQRLEGVVRRRRASGDF